MADLTLTNQQNATDETMPDPAMEHHVTGHDTGRPDNDVPREYYFSIRIRKKTSRSFSSTNGN